MNVLGDERHSEVKSHSIREMTESYDLTEQENEHEIDILHNLAVEALGVKTTAIGMSQKLEELDILKR